MAANQTAGDSLASNLAGMSKKQLYDIMSQMKSLIEHNQQQARQVLIDNPLLTRALFQAQIMLGMVQPPQAVTSIQPQAPQPSKPIQQTNTHLVHLAPSQAGSLDQPNVSQAQAPVIKQHQNQSSMPMSSNPGPGFHSQPVPSRPIELPRAHLNAQTTQMGHLQSSQVPNMPPLPVHSGSQTLHRGPTPAVQSHMQQTMQTSSVGHHMLQPPLPPQPRPPMQVPLQPPTPPNMNFPNAGIPQMPRSQPMFHPSSRPPSGMGPSFPQGQPPLPNQPPHQQLYQSGGSHLGTEFRNRSGNTGQMGTSLRPPVSRENLSGLPHLGPLPSGPGQMPLSNHPPPRPAPLSPEMEKQLLQQVMSLTPEQINLLPPDQRNQVLELQQMLRK